MADPTAVWLACVDQQSHPAWGDDWKAWGTVKEIEHDNSVLERAERNLSNDERVTCDFAFNNRNREIVVVPAQVIDPNRGVRKIHAFGRSLGGAEAPGSTP